MRDHAGISSGKFRGGFFFEETMSKKPATQKQKNQIESAITKVRFMRVDAEERIEKILRVLIEETGLDIEAINIVRGVESTSVEIVLAI